MKQLFPRISIGVILIVINGICDSLCKSISGGVIQEMRGKALLQDFNDLPQMMSDSKHWKRLISSFSISLNIRQCQCARKSVFINTFDLWLETWLQGSKGLDFVLIGDCLPGCQLLSFYGFLRTPTLVNGCMSEVFNSFPFMIRLIGAWRQMAQPFYEFVKNFGWRKVAIIYSYRDMINTGALQIIRFFRDQGMTVSDHQVDDYSSFTNPNDLTRMTEAAKQARRETGSKQCFKYCTQWKHFSLLIIFQDETQNSLTRREKRRC